MIIRLFDSIGLLTINIATIGIIAFSAYYILINRGRSFMKKYLDKIIIYTVNLFFVLSIIAITYFGLGLLYKFLQYIFAWMNV